MQYSVTLNSIEYYFDSEKNAIKFRNNPKKYHNKIIKTRILK